MKALLVAINAKYIHSNLAVYSLKACAGPYKEQVELAELGQLVQKNLRNLRIFINFAS